MGSYKVVFSRDESGWWQARVPGAKGCHTQGRTIEEARRRIREALGLFVDDADTARLVDSISLPHEVQDLLTSYRRLQKKVADEQKELSTVRKRAVKILRTGALKLSVRDAADMLGLSHQRVNQLEDADSPSLSRHHRQAKVAR